MKLKLFITGTDTNVGKTYITVGLLKLFNQQGLSTLGLKPVASGGVDDNGVLYNEDALAIRKASSIKLNYNDINPILFKEPIAPSIAAKYSNFDLNVALIQKKCAYAMNFGADVCIVEGVGGWNVPLNDKENMADFVKLENFQIILVVSTKLGCLNHAILTYNAIKKDNLPIYGWIANCMDSNIPNAADNIATLKHWLKVPCLGVVKHKEDPAKVIEVAGI